MGDYNFWDWLIPIVSGAIGALIGTYGGSYLILRKQEQKIKNVRSMAIKALNIFAGYALQKKSYIDATSEFNTKLNTSEKRAIVVALHKLGVPFESPFKDTINVKNLRFRDVSIDKDEILEYTHIILEDLLLASFFNFSIRVTISLYCLAVILLSAKSNLA